MGTGESADIEEERRLLYVAMTRARDHLHVVTPQRFYVQQQRRLGDKNVYAIRTRFIPSNILACFEETYWAENAPGEQATTTMLQQVDLGARARGMWSGRG